MVHNQIVYGNVVAERIRQNILEEVAKFKVRPKLGILSFNTPASQLYKSAQCKRAESLGVDTLNVTCDLSMSQNELEGIIREWNVALDVHGIFIHQPVPSHIDPQRLSTVIEPRKDIEGIHPHNMARRFFSKARIGSCTALAVMELLDSIELELEGKECVVIGHSEIVGRPVGMLLLDRDATVTVCHSGTTKAGKLEFHVRRAEILVVAVGRPRLIPGEWIRSGATVIDVGINIVDGKPVGDVNFEEALKQARFITPVPGGVGPVTVMMVMKNLIEAHKLQHIR